MDKTISGSRNRRNGAISGSRNRRKGRQILYETRTPWSSHSPNMFRTRTTKGVDMLQTQSRHHPDMFQTHSRQVQTLSRHVLCSRYSLDMVQTQSRYVQTPTRQLVETIWTPSRHPPDTFNKLSWHFPDILWGNQFWLPGLFRVTNFGSQVCSG